MFHQTTSWGIQRHAFHCRISRNDWEVLRSVKLLALLLSRVDPDNLLETALLDYVIQPANLVQRICVRLSSQVWPHLPWLYPSIFCCGSVQGPSLPSSFSHQSSVGVPWNWINTNVFFSVQSVYGVEILSKPMKRLLLYGRAKLQWSLNQWIKFKSLNKNKKKPVEFTVWIYKSVC